MSATTSTIRMDDGNGWKVICDKKSVSKIFIQCDGTKAQVDVKESNGGQFATKYNSNMKQMEIESTKDNSSNDIQLIRLNDGTKWGFIYDKKASNVVFQCDGTKAQVDVKESNGGQFATVHNGTIRKMEIEYAVAPVGEGGDGVSTSIPTYIWSDQAMLEELFDIRKPLVSNKAKRYLNGASQTVENSGASYFWHNDSQMRVHVMYPGNFTDDDGPTEDFAEGLDGQWLTIAQRGYMLDSREASHGIILVDAEVHPTSSEGSGGLTIEAFSGLLHDETVVGGRAGACYHWEINLNGESAIQKEQVHVDYTSQIIGGSEFNTKQRWQMICVCKRINDADRMAGTTIELWAKRPGQTQFVKDVFRVDAHNWGDAMKQFHSSFAVGQAITWGADCAVTFKGNNRDYRVYDFKVYKLNYT